MVKTHFAGRSFSRGKRERGSRQSMAGFRLRIQNGKDAFPSRSAGLNQLVQAVESGDRLIKHPHIKKEGHEFADGHPAFQNRPSAEPENEAGAPRSNQGHRRVVNSPSAHDF